MTTDILFFFWGGEGPILESYYDIPQNPILVLRVAPIIKHLSSWPRPRFSRGYRDL